MSPIAVGALFVIVCAAAGWTVGILHGIAVELGAIRRAIHGLTEAVRLARPRSEFFREPSFYVPPANDTPKSGDP